jgi:hypothetical protein
LTKKRKRNVAFFSLKEENTFLKNKNVFLFFNKKDFKKRKNFLFSEKIKKAKSKIFVFSKKHKFIKKFFQNFINLCFFERSYLSFLWFKKNC